jgi:hypothetical protein
MQEIVKERLRKCRCRRWSPRTGGAANEPRSNAHGKARLLGPGQLDEIVHPVDAYNALFGKPARRCPRRPAYPNGVARYHEHATPSPRAVLSTTAAQASWNAHSARSAKAAGHPMKRRESVGRVLLLLDLRTSGVYADANTGAIVVEGAVSLECSAPVIDGRTRSPLVLEVGTLTVERSQNDKTPSVSVVGTVGGYVRCNGIAVTFVLGSVSDVGACAACAG